MVVVGVAIAVSARVVSRAACGCAGSLTAVFRLGIGTAAGMLRRRRCPRSALTRPRMILRLLPLWRPRRGRGSSARWA